MIKEIDNLKLINVIRVVSAQYDVYSDRPSHAVLFKLSGTSRYTYERGTVDLSRGEILFVPKGSSYSVRLLTEGESYCLVVNFDADIPGAVSMVHTAGRQRELESIGARIERLWAVQTAANKCRCMSLLCEALACMTESGQNADKADNRLLIRPALEYLEQNIFHPSLRIGRLHLLCDISDTYFRRIFISCLGKSPKRYVMDRRISQAKAIIDNGEYKNISEVARMTGFEDALYFSKVYKSRYGRPPSGHRQ